MKICNNCRSKKLLCPFLKYPMYHSGYTGKSGELTWYWCEFNKAFLRHIKKCELAGNKEKQREALISLQKQELSEVR